MAIKKEKLLGSVRAAKAEVTIAEEDLTKLVAELDVSAEKTSIGAVLDSAFDRLRTARTLLAALESAVAEDKD